MLVLGAVGVMRAITSSEAPDQTASSPAIGGAFTLIDTGGRTVTDRTFRGKWLLIYFGYTYCPDACPTALNNMSVALRALGSDANKIAPLFITVDPKRDTVQAIAEYLRSFDSRIVGLTGSQEQIDAVVKAYRVYVDVQKAGDDDYLVDHSSFFYLMNPGGRFVNVVPGDASGERLAAKLRSEMSETGR